MSFDVQAKMCETNSTVNYYFMPPTKLQQNCCIINAVIVTIRSLICIAPFSNPRMAHNNNEYTNTQISVRKKTKYPEYKNIPPSINKV